MIAVRAVDAEWVDANADALGAILLACVADGASVSFLADLTQASTLTGREPVVTG